MAWQHGCHGNHSRQSVYVSVHKHVCTAWEGWMHSEGWIQWFCVNVCEGVCLAGSLWDTVRRELGWLVKGPGGQRGDNSFLPFFSTLLSLSDFFFAPLPSPLPLLPPLFLAMSRCAWLRGTNMLPSVQTLLTGVTSPANMITMPQLSAGQPSVETLTCRFN